MSTVYIVASGENGEGHSPLSAHATLDGAKDQVGLVAPDAAPVERVTHRTWRTVMSNGVDELWIYSMPVRGGQR